MSDKRTLRTKPAGSRLGVIALWTLGLAATQASCSPGATPTTATASANSRGTSTGERSPNFDESTGALMLSGPITDAFHPDGSCPPFGLQGMPIQGRITFRSGTNAAQVTFAGRAGTNPFMPAGQFPAGEFALAMGNDAWHAGVSNPSVGTLTLSMDTAGRIHAMVSGSLPPTRGATSPLQVSGSWTC